MKKTHSLFALKAIILYIFLGLISVAAMPKYLVLNKQQAATQCKSNQIIVETALAVAYAENLANGKQTYPDKLSQSMFVDGKIPVCPVDGTPFQFDSTTGKVHCPNHIASHNRDEAHLEH
ncbi:MAG: hypothetical protein SCK70_07555 [bacterium]|nr:hypothetical protein [bacterium]